MIRLNKDRPKDGMQKLLDAIYNVDEYYHGSYHENVDISNIIDCVYSLLYDQNNKEAHIIIEKNANNSLNILVDKTS